MGCTMSTRSGLVMRHADSSSACIFKVTNVDNNGEDRNPGYIEITTESLILHQRGKESIAWPLHGLRRYGFDADLFSFESGRRCPTGPGIYAFRCRRAEALFNLLQNSIVIAGQSDVVHRTGTVVDSSWRQTASSVPTQPLNQMLSLQPVAVVRPVSTQLTLSQYRNVPESHHVLRTSSVPRPSLARLPDILSVSNQQADEPVHYAELDLNRHVDEEEYQDDDDLDVFDPEDRVPASQKPSSRFYVNLAASQNHSVPTSSSCSTCGYANLDLISRSEAADNLSSSGVKVNYIQLDLSTETVDITEQASPITSPISMRTLSMSQQSDVPRVSITGESYTTIDFDRTRALNTISVDTTGNTEEGVRRTRHNSNIV